MAPRLQERVGSLKVLGVPDAPRHPHAVRGGGAVTAVLGAAVVVVRRKVVTHEAEARETRHVAEDSVTVFAN